jgi:hydroxypyruvate isomerase
MDSKKTLRSDTVLTARQRAEQYGIDVSLIDINLQKTPYERLQNHNQALKLATQLREAMEHPHD